VFKGLCGVARTRRNKYRASKVSKSEVTGWHLLHALWLTFFFGLLGLILSILAIAVGRHEFRYTRGKCKNKIKFTYHIAILPANIPPRTPLTTIWHSLAIGAGRQRRGRLGKATIRGRLRLSVLIQVYSPREFTSTGALLTELFIETLTK